MDGNFDFQTMTTTPRTFPQIDLVDVQDNQVNVQSLASSHHLILITLKSASCPICPQLLKILNVYGLDPDTNNFTDPFTLQKLEMDSVRKRFFRLLLKFDAYFIILCPGTNSEVSQIQRETPFLDYPFIAGEQANVLAKALKVQISKDMFMPAILEVRKGTLSVDSIYIGREPGRYFHHHLLTRLIDERCKLESSGIICIKDTYEVMNQLKRKLIKCQQGKMAASFSLEIITSPTKGLITTYKNKQIKKQKTLQDLPLELLENIFSFYSHDISSLVKTSRTCRIFYITACNVMILCLRNQMTFLKPALPQENGKVICHETEVRDQSLDRWSNNEQPIPFRELQKRVQETKENLLNIAQWTRHWSPRRLKTSY